jgi:hypothetical protein
MSIKVMISRSIELTDPQIALLRFFADLKEPPAIRRNTMYAALEVHGLIAADPKQRYAITELGRDVLAQVEEHQPGTFR